MKWGSHAIQFYFLASLSNHIRLAGLVPGRTICKKRTGQPGKVFSGNGRKTKGEKPMLDESIELLRVLNVYDAIQVILTATVAIFIYRYFTNRS